MTVLSSDAAMEWHRAQVYTHCYSWGTSYDVKSRTKIGDDLFDETGKYFNKDLKNCCEVQPNDLKPQHSSCFPLRNNGGLQGLSGPNSSITFRPLRPSDFDILKELHEELFPVRYENDFFLNVVHGRGIVSWAAVDSSRGGDQHDEIIGFVTTRVVSTADVDTTGMLGYELSRTDRNLVYILTLGVIKPYRKHGIASSLISKVLAYASSISTCKAVYLHVISYNTEAIRLYEKNSFVCSQKLEDFYYINSYHYDAYLYVHYVNGGRAPCLALDFLISISSFVRTIMTSMAAKFRRREARINKANQV